MLDRPMLATEAGRAPPAGGAAPRWPLLFVGVAGCLGAAGVVVGAAGAHVGGGDVARTASEFLLVHAVALVGTAAVALGVRRTPLPLLAAMVLLAVGAALFGGELALASLLDWRPVPLAAPAGGLCLIAGWLLLVPGAVAAGLRRG